MAPSGHPPSDRTHGTRSNDAYPSTSTTRPTAATPQQQQPRQRKMIRRVDGILATFCALGIVFLQQFKMPLEAYTGVSINFKTPSVLRPSDEELLQQQLANEYTSQHEMIFANDDDVFLSSDEDGSHDARARWLLPPLVKAWEEYQFHHSHYQLQDELYLCKERANVNDDEHIHDVVKEGWCPELQGRNYLVLTQPSCQSPKTLLERYLRVIPWAMVTNRTLLWRELVFDNDNDNEATECKGVLNIDETSLASFEFWKKQLDLPDPVAWDVTNLDRDIKDTPLVVTLTNIPELDAFYMKRPHGKRMADILLDDESTPILYGMLLDETLVFDEPEMDPLYKNSNSDGGMALFQDDDDEYSSTSEDSGNDDSKHGKFYLFANLRPAQSSISTSQKGYVDEECVDTLQWKHPLNPCVVYNVGGASPKPFSHRRLAGHNGENNAQLSSCVVNNMDLRPQNFVPALAFAAQARHGLILPQENDMSSEEIAFTTLLQQLITYRGMLGDDPKFELPICRVSK